MQGNCTRPGSYAEFILVDERIVGKKPKKLSFEEAAAEPLTALTAFEALCENMDIRWSSEGTNHSAIIGRSHIGQIQRSRSSSLQVYYQMHLDIEKCIFRFCR